MFITNFAFIPLMIIWVICIISAFNLDKVKKDEINQTFKIIKRTISFIFAIISIFFLFF